MDREPWEVLAEDTRLWTAAEIDLLAHAWGPRTLWYHLPMRVWRGGPARIEFDDEGDPVATRKLYLPDDADAESVIHEAGHAIHLSMFPESAKWPTEQCETFAMLGIVRARLEGRYGPLPEIAAAQAVVARHPLRYDLAMQMVADMAGGGSSI